MVMEFPLTLTKLIVPGAAGNVEVEAMIVLLLVKLLKFSASIPNW